MDDKDIAIMLQIIADPRSTNKEIAEQTEISEATVSRRIKALKAVNTKNGKVVRDRILRGIKIEFNRAKLGLEVISLILTPARPWQRSMILLQLLFQRHAYTAYQNRIFGKNNGLLVQLNLPNDSINYLSEFLDLLKDIGLITSYQSFRKTHNTLNYSVDPSKYDISSRRFDFDYIQIREKMKEKFYPPQLDSDDADLKLLKPDNFYLLYQLNRDADRTLSEIGEQLGMTKQEVSRRRNELGLDEWKYEVLYDREQFGVFNQVLYKLKDVQEGFASLHAILKDTFPFHASILPCSSNLLLRIDLPAVDVMRFTDILHEVFEEVEFYLLDRRALTYPPWSGNLSDGKWLIDKNKVMRVYMDDQFETAVSLEEFISHYSTKSVPDLNNLVYKSK